MNPSAPARAFALVGGTLFPLDVRPGADIHDVFDDLPLGVYSALRSHGCGRFLGLELHLDRTERSMRRARLGDRLDRAELRRAIAAACADFPVDDVRVRFDVLAAPIVVASLETQQVLCIAAHRPVPGRFLREGVRVEVAHGLLREDPITKRARFVIERRPRPIGTQEAYEHLLLDAGRNILEGTSSNFFGVRGDVIVTAGEGVLEGITQKLLFGLLPRLGLRAEARALPLDAVGSLDESFLTSSTRGVVPIVNVAGVRVGSGKPGTVTRRLMDAYDALAASAATPA